MTLSYVNRREASQIKMGASSTTTVVTTTTIAAAVGE